MPERYPSNTKNGVKMYFGHVFGVFLGVPECQAGGVFLRFFLVEFDTEYEWAKVPPTMEVIGSLKALLCPPLLTQGTDPRYRIRGHKECERVAERNFLHSFPLSGTPVVHSYWAWIDSGLGHLGSLWQAGAFSKAALSGGICCDDDLGFFGPNFGWGPRFQIPLESSVAQSQG